jgi:energy-coupling factor transporter ATP-binding protein EcfA2
MLLLPFSDHDRGLFISVDGPSGAGKSTLVQHLAQMLVAAGETVHVTGSPPRMVNFDCWIVCQVNIRRSVSSWRQALARLMFIRLRVASLGDSVAAPYCHHIWPVTRSVTRKRSLTAGPRMISEVV